MTTHHNEAPTFGRDTRAAFLGLVIGAIVVFAILFTIVKLTAARYSHEKPAATATQ